MKTPVVLVVGPAGTGKSTASHILARRLRAAHLDKDAVTRRFVEAMLKSQGLPEGDRESRYYQDVCHPLEYDTLVATAVEVARAGCPVVMDAPFGVQLANVIWWRQFSTALAAIGAHPTVLLLSVPSDEWRTRVVARGAIRDTGKLANWQAFAGDLPTIAEGIPVVQVSNAGTRADLDARLAILAGDL